MANAGAVGPEDVEVTRLQRERDDVARPRRDPARCHRDQEVAGAFSRDMRLVAEPLIRHDAHADIARSDRNLLWADADPDSSRLAKCLPRSLIEQLAWNLERDIGADRQAETAIGGGNLC